MLQNLAPLMILPVAGSTQTEAMGFFEHISVKHLNEYQPSESWRKTLMLLSQTVPSVRYAAIALALIYRNHLDRHFRDNAYRWQAKDRLPEDAPLLYYNQAIQSLLNHQEIGDSSEKTAITLLVCYLFTCYDNLAGNYVQAMKHLRGGVELSRSIDKPRLGNNDAQGSAKTSGVNTLTRQVIKQIRRLDRQAVTFLVDWTPAEIQHTHVSQLPTSVIAFGSLDQAADCLQILVAQVMRLRNAELQIPPIKLPPSPWILKDNILGQLKTWLGLFENMLQQSGSHEKGSEMYRITLLLRLQYKIAWTFLSSYGPGKEMEYDKFLPQFQECVTLARHVATAHERYSGSLNPTFTPEIGILPVLYITGAKCRDPTVRREVLRILRRQLIQEAVWDSISAARVIERITEIEETGWEGGRAARRMEEIALWQRIETVSWVQTVSGHSAVTRLDIRYTFCGQEGTRIETLML
jgi:hypothetical protein